MKINKSNVFMAACLFLFSALVCSLGSKVTNIALELSIFQLKLSAVLFAVHICLDDEVKKKD